MLRREAIGALAAVGLAVTLAWAPSCSNFADGPTGDEAGAGEASAAEAGADVDASSSSAYESLVLGGKPLVYWRFGGAELEQADKGSAKLPARASTTVRLGQPSLVNEPGDRSIRMVAGDAITTDPTPDWFVPMKAFSIECWVRVESAPIPAEILMRGSITTGVGLSFDATGKLKASRYENGVGSKIGLTVLRAKENHHVVVTYNGALLSLFIDGKADESVPATTPLLPSSVPITFGKPTPSAGGTQLDAFVDEVAIYDRDLKVDEITAHARAGGIFLP